VATQKARNYKAGWVYYQMDKLVEKNRPHLRAYNTNLADKAHYIAQGLDTLHDVEEALKTEWSMYLEDIARFGE